MICLGSGELRNNQYRFINICPITRKRSNLFPPSLITVPTISRVRDWKMLVGKPYEFEYKHHPAWTFVDFCRAISKSPPRSLQIVLLPEIAKDVHGHTIERKHYQRWNTQC